MRLIYLFLFVAILLQSCQYEPTGSHYVDVDYKLDPATLTIEVLNSKDTIWVEQNKSSSIKIKITGDINKMVRFYVLYDSVTNIFSTSASAGSFILPKVKTDSFEYHTIDIIATTRSGSGSLADFVGTEGLMYQKHYVLVYFKKM